MLVKMEIEVCPPPRRARLVTLDGDIVVMIPGGVMSIDPMDTTKHYNKVLKPYSYKLKKVGSNLFKLSSL